MMQRFHGYVDGVFDGDVVGWAFDQTAPSVPIVITVRVNGAAEIRALACQHRADVAAAFGTSGLHGFRVSLAHGAPSQPVEIEVTCEDGEPLSHTTPLRAALPDHPRRQREGPCVLFMHIQKTAGTSFREAILQNYSSAETALIYPDPPGLPREQFHLMPLEQRSSLRCVIGHFDVGLHEEMGQPSEYATIIRDPIQRVISHYRHMCRMRVPEVLSASGNVTPLEALLESRASLEMDNLLTRCFCGKEGYPLGTYVNEGWYERAVANLQRFRFIGHQERSAEAWAGLSNLYGWNQGTLGNLNVGQETPLEVSARTLAAIQEHNRYDVLLYKEATCASRARTRPVSD